MHADTCIPRYDSIKPYCLSSLLWHLIKSMVRFYILAIVKVMERVITPFFLRYTGQFIKKAPLILPSPFRLIRFGID